MPDSKSQAQVEMRHLRLVAAIVEHGSMTAAGRALNLTQPAMSHQLRELETRLSTPLFVRTTRRMVLTPAGEQLHVIARLVLAQIDAFQQQIHQGEFVSPRGTVRLATECYTAYHWLPAVLRTFRERWPNVELCISAEHTAAPIAALRDGSLDLAVVYNPVVDKRIKLSTLFEDDLVIIAAPTHRFAKSEFVAVKALAKEHVFIYSSLTRNSLVVREILEPAGITPAQLTRIQLTEAIIELVAAGLGVAVMARWAVLPALRSGAVIAIRIGRNGFRRTWYAATRSADVTPAYQFDLVELLRRHLFDGPTHRR